MTGIEHIGVFSKNSAALKDWYIKLFGWKQVYDNGKGTYFLAADDGTMMEFCMGKEDGGVWDAGATGIRHIAISVDDFEGTVEKVRTIGAEIVTEAVLNDKGVGTMFFRDPDGNILHLIYREKPLY